MEKRLFIVSNRLPVTIDEEKGIQHGAGGLVTAIQSYLSKLEKGTYQDVLWCGFPGCDDSTWNVAQSQIGESTFNYLPVFIPPATYDKYYNGHANEVLWPLFHYFPSYAEYNIENYEAYKKVNHLFARALIQQLKAEDILWIHDYHLLPLAALIRKAIPDITIGYFLHIPFPSFELFRLMPRKWQEDCLLGMLGADMVGFHTIDYASHFLECVSMVLGLDNDHNVVNHNNRLIKTDVFPISIDYKKFNDAYDDPKVTSLRNDFRKQMGTSKVIFSIDRLDYTKGVHNRLRAYECFLKQNPSYHGRVVFIMVIIPSRDTIPKYMERKKMIDELISDINSKVGNIHWVPVIYQYNSLEFNEMISLYSSCDLALITPMRDGMNLVSKEFVASRKDKQGVLVISEMAGAARELTDALIINPNDITEMANKIKEGLEMKKEDQAVNIENMQKRISNYDVQAWADDFMTELFNIKNKQQSFQIKFLDEQARKNMFDSYRKSSRRLLLLDYDGTLVSFSANPEMAVPDDNLLKLMHELSSHAENDVFIISGRSSSWLEKHFGKLPINLIAEHGARYKWKLGPWRTDIQSHNEWKEQVHNIMQMFVRRCANSFVEEKDYSMVWHYRNAGAEQGKLRAYELMNELNDYIHNRHLQVLMGNKIVEVRQSGINKGSFIKKIIDNKNYDYIFAVGDDRTDEDMFKILMNRENTFTIKVGTDASYAQYNLYTPQMVVSLLGMLNELKSEPVTQ